MAGSVVVGSFKEATASFSRATGTTQYASGDLVANSATAASVSPMSFVAARGPGNSFMIRRARLFKDDDDTTSAQFRLHLFSGDPTATAPSNGDNGAIQLTDILTKTLGAFDFDMTASPDIHTDGNYAVGIPLEGTEIGAKLSTSTGTIYGLLEARGTYTPADSETFTVVLEILQD